MSALGPGEPSDYEIVETDGPAPPDQYRPEWKEGWPRGTWLRTIDDRIIESPGYVAQDSEGSKGYHVHIADTRMRVEFIYLTTFHEARTPDGAVYRRLV